MWINPNNHQVYSTHSEIRGAFKNVSFPTEMTDDDIAFVGVLPVTQAAKPEFDSLVEKVIELVPVLINGEWTQQWQVVEMNDEEKIAAYRASVPQVITIRQAKLALLQAGLFDDVEGAIAQATRTVQIEWESATEFRRDWPALLAMQPALGLTDEQIDDLFRLAATL